MRALKFIVARDNSLIIGTLGTRRFHLGTNGVAGLLSVSTISTNLCPPLAYQSVPRRVRFICVSRLRDKRFDFQNATPDRMTFI
jgi:hypothetical protein